jgi:hypothetical protein
MATVVIISLSILVIISLYVIVISYNKIEKLESLLKDSYSENDELFDFIVEVNQRLFQDYESLKEVDKRGSFESDDEVGFVFNTIKNTVEDSYAFVNKYLNPSKDEQEED